MCQLSVIIPTFNRRDSLLRALSGLVAQICPPEFEVVVVSDGSTDGTADAASSKSFPFRLTMVEQQNQGPSVARNHGAKLAAAPLLVYMDDDIEPVPQFLEAHAREHVNDPSLVLIGPQSGPENEPMSHWVAWEHRMLQKQYANFISGVWTAGPNNLYSGNFSIRREHLIESGGFNEKFTRQEDVELGFRLERQGLRFRFCPEAVGIHRPTRSFESWYRTPYEYGKRDVQMAREGGEDRAIALARKHYSERNRLTQVTARLCTGRPVLEDTVLGIGRAAVRIGGRSVALTACSMLFNLRYLQGMCQELGGRKRLWSALNGEAPSARSAKSEGV